MTTKNEVEASRDSGLIIIPATEEGRRRAREALPQLRALQEEILTSRGGKLIDVDAALREARAAHQRGE